MLSCTQIRHWYVQPLLHWQHVIFTITCGTGRSFVGLDRDYSIPFHFVWYPSPPPLKSNFVFQVAEVVSAQIKTWRNSISRSLASPDAAFSCKVSCAPRGLEGFGGQIPPSSGWNFPRPGLIKIYLSLYKLNKYAYNSHF